MTYRAVLFDMDGVVVDTGHTVAAFWQKLARSAGFTISERDLDDHVYGRSADHTLRALFPQIPPDRHPEVYELLKVNDQTLRYSEIPGATKLLRQLGDGKVLLALVTGAQHWKVIAVLDQLGLTDAFDIQIRAEDVHRGKPDPACYRLAAERLRVDIAQCLVFEDALSGIEAAVSAGASCVALGQDHRAATLGAAGAMAVVRDLQQVDFASHDRVMRIGPEIEISFARS